MIKVYKIKTTFCALFFSLLLVMNSGYMLQVSKGGVQNFIQYFTIIAFLIFAFYYFVMCGKIRRSGSSQSIFLLFSLISLLSMVINGERINAYLNFIGIIFIAFFVVQVFEVKQIAKVYINVMVIISIISLAFMLWISFFGIPSTSLMVSTTASENECHNYIVFFYPKLWASTLGRNRGVFWEPGLFASYLIIALMLEACFSEKISKLRVVILVMTILTTMSTAGILLLMPAAIVFVDRLVENPHKRSRILVVLWLIIIIMFFSSDVIVRKLVEINPLIFSKLLGEESTKVTRLGAPMLNMNIFLHHPIFGAGLGGATTLFQAQKATFLADSQTSTSLFMMAAFGIGGILYTIWWVRGIISIKSYSLTRRIGILFTMLMITNKEPHTSMMATWMILFIFLKMSYSKEMNNN